MVIFYEIPDSISEQEQKGTCADDAGYGDKRSAGIKNTDYGSLIKGIRHDPYQPVSRIFDNF